MEEKFLKNSFIETTLRISSQSICVEKYILKGKINEMKQKIYLTKKLNKIPLIINKMKIIKNKFETFDKYLKIKNNQIIDNLIIKNKKIQRRTKKKERYKQILAKINDKKLENLKKEFKVFDFEKKFEGNNKKNYFLFKKKIDSEFFK